MGMAATLQKVSQTPLIDAFLLGPAERTVAAYPEARRQKVRDFFAAAELRSRGADELFEGNAQASLALFREAALLYKGARVAAEAGAELVEPLRAAEITAQF